MDNEEVTRLDLSDVKLYGRESELSKLLAAYQRASQRQTNIGSSEMAIVSGEAGTGKSALIEKMRSSLVAQGSPAFIISGNFDSINRDKPFSALTQAFTELCEQILDRDENGETFQMQNTVREAMGAEGVAIRTSFDLQFQEIVEDFARRTDSHDRFKASFRKVFRVSCSPSHPVVIFLEDLQWADMASLELINALLMDEMARHVLFICTYRPEATDYPREDAESYLKALESKQAVRITKVHLGNLDVHVVNHLISDLLTSEENMTIPLAAVIHRKTSGNALSVLHFIKMLQEKGFLNFSFATLKWSWDVDDIASQTLLSDNVLDLVLSKLRKLPQEAQMLLLIAACLGAQFESELLAFVLAAYRGGGSFVANGFIEGRKAETTPSKHTSTTSRSGDKRRQMLRMVIDEGLVDKGVGSKYKFAHDQIHQASFCLVPEGVELDFLHLWIGELLWGHRDALQDKYEHYLFVLTNLLNVGSSLITDESKRVRLARLNLEAGTAAMALCAFGEAAVYLRAGLSLLGGERQWEKDYSLCLDLYNSLAEVEYCFCCDNFDECKKIVDVVMMNAQSMEDKIHVSSTMIKLLVTQECFEDALDLGFETLSLLGEKMRTKRLLFALKEIVWTNKMIKGRSDDELLMLPEMDDKKKILAMMVLRQLIPAATRSKQREKMAIVACRMVQLSVRCGVSEFSAIGFAFFGVVICGFKNDIMEGYRYGLLSISFLERFGADKWKPDVYVVMYGFLHHWKHPIQECLDPLLKGYEAGIESGHISAAMSSATAYCGNYVFSGLPLAPLEEDVRSFSEEMVEYGRTGVLNTTLPLWQYILNLMGRSENPVMLVGEAMDQEVLLDDAVKKKHYMAVALVSFLRLDLACQFGDLDLGLTMAEESGKFAYLSSHFFLCRRAFLVGLIAVDMRRKANKRKWKILFRKSIAFLEKRAELASGDCFHMIVLLKAEYMSLRGNVIKVKEAFDRAISTAARSGYTQDRALANEKAGTFFVKAGDSHWASYYLSEAYELYCEWGARGKADHLQQQHHSLLATCTGGRRRGVGYRGRSRFNSMRKRRTSVFSSCNLSNHTRSSHTSESNDSSVLRSFEKHS